jgi:hypothetical protein
VPEPVPTASRLCAVTIVCLGVAGLAVLGAWLPDWTYPYWNWNVFAPTFKSDFKVSEVERQLAPILEQFPPTAMIGLITDHDLLSSEDRGKLMVVRYVLRPRQAMLTGEKSHPEWAIGVLKESGKAAALGASQGYEVQRVFETGVILFHRAIP